MHSPRLSSFWLALVAIAAGYAQAGDRGLDRRAVESAPSRGSVDRIILADGGMSLDQAVSMVERRFKARVVRTEVRNEGNRKVYVLRLLNDEGRVWTVRVDAASGSVN
jgi:uncharacterized membrane protein YkoI